MSIISPAENIEEGAFSKTRLVLRKALEKAI
jgi:hypothetical protein